MFTINCSTAAAQWLEGRVWRKTTWWEKADWWIQLITDNIWFLGAGEDIDCHRRWKEGKGPLCVAQSGRQYQTNLWLLPLFSWGALLRFRVQYVIEPLIGGGRYTGWSPRGPCASTQKNPQPRNHGGGAVRLHRCYTGGPPEVEKELFTILHKDNFVTRRRPWCLLPEVLRSYLWTLLRLRPVWFESWRVLQVRAQMSAMIGVTSQFHISWNSVMIASPQTIMLDPKHVGKRLMELQDYFDPQQVNSILNPVL